MGRRLPGLLSGAGITYTEIKSGEDIGMVDRELVNVFDGNSVHAFLMSPAVWEGSECSVKSSEFPRLECSRAGSARSAECGSAVEKRQEAREPTLTRYDIIKLIAPYLDGKAVVSNLGWPSKELFAIRHQSSNFYMLGSMGMATPVGLGMALSSSKQVVVIDGDGSLLMNPGTLATAASVAPRNLTIIAIDNGAYGSTGNQPTLASSCVDLEAVARGFGFRNAVTVAGEERILEVMKKPEAGLTFVHVLAIPENKDVPNIPIHHLEIKRQVQRFLKG
jgi:sulfopyruvate decarboxylase subunit beta